MNLPHHELLELYAERLPILEEHCALQFGQRTIATNLLHPNLRKVWKRLSLDAAENLVSYKKRYVFDLFRSLLDGTGYQVTDEASRMVDPWHDFVDFVRIEAPNHVDGYLLGATYWCEAFNGASLTLGWLLLNAIRVQHGLTALKLNFTRAEIENCLQDFKSNDGRLFGDYLYKLMSDGEELPEY